MNKEEANTLITSVLTKLGYCTNTFVTLLMATMAQESHLGVYETQGGHGPARGIYRMEDATFQDIYANFLSYHSALKAAVDSYKPNLNTTFNADWLIHNHEYATALAACVYIRHHTPAITVEPTPEALWPIYKQWYNTYAGAATQSQFLTNYNTYINANT
jgi:hypothetical protein